MEASISFCLEIRCSHHREWANLAFLDQSSSAARGISHSSQDVPSALFNFSRSGSSISWCFPQMTSTSALLAMDASVTCGTRL